MGLFADQMLVHLSDPVRLAQFLAPPGDPGGTRPRALLDAVLDLPFARLHEIRDMEVKETRIERPITPLRRLRGSVTQTIPSYTLATEVSESEEPAEPLWLDISARLAMTVVLEVDQGDVESIIVREITDVATLEEFRDRFQFFDLDAFLAEHGISTIEELRAHAHYLKTEIRLRPPGPFDPNDPANLRHYRLNVAILIREAIDLVAALRTAQSLRVTLERDLTYHREQDQAAIRTPYAPVVIFPESLLAGLPFDAATVRALFARERMLALFATPP